MMPSPGTKPRVGFSVYNPARVAGTTKEPSVSVPIETGASPAATATAEPDDEPPVLFRVSGDWRNP